MISNQTLVVDAGPAAGRAVREQRESGLEGRIVRRDAGSLATAPDVAGTD